MVQPAEKPDTLGRGVTAAESTRLRILEAARDLFARHGYDGTSVRMVARACGLTNPAIHYHFRTKRDLYDALLSSSIRSDSPVPLQDRLTVIAHMESQFFAWVENLPFARLLLRQQIGGDPQSMEYLRQSEADYVAEISAALSRFHSQPVATKVAETSFALLCGAFWDALLTYGPEADTVMRDDYFRARIRGLIEAVLEMGNRLEQ